MKTTIASLIAVICLFTSTLFAQHIADIPHVISYQGKITSATTALPDGEHTFTVRLYSDEQGTTVLWQGEYRTTVTDGLFNLQLGSGGQDLPAVHSGLWLGMQIDGGKEMKPYTSITSAPYALNVANGSITAEKMNTDYVSSIRVNGKKIGGKASELNIIGGGGVSLLYDEKSQALLVYDAPINATPQSGAIQDVNKGGTGVGTITQNGIVWGNGTNPISATTLNNGQLLIGSTGNAPVAASLTGTANQVTVTSGSGSITLSTPQSIGTSSSPTFSGLTLSGKATSAATAGADAATTLTTKGYVDGAISTATALSSGKVMIGTTGGTPTAANLTGTTNQINISSASGSITLSTPQNIATTSSPTFSGLTLSGKATSAATSGADASTTLTTKGYVDGAIATATALPSGQIMVGTTGGTPTATSLTGTSNQINVSSASGSITLSTPQNIGTTSSPTFSNLTLNGKATSTATTGADAVATLTTKGYVDDAIANIPIVPSWELAGNAGTSSSDFIGTTDAADLSFRTDNTERMKITADGAFLMNGTSGATPASGNGTRMMWIPAKGSFRAGQAMFNKWNDGNIGNYSFAAGYSTLASSDYSTAFGFSSSATGISSFAAGSAANAVSDGSAAMGSATNAVGLSSFAMGDNATAWSDVSFAMGESVEANGFGSFATGNNTITNGDGAFTSGQNLYVGAHSFGFNGTATNTVANLTSLGRVAYFGDVDIMIGNTENSPRSLKFYESNSSGTYSGTNYTAIKAQNQSANITYTLPASQGAAGSVMTNNGSGTMSWSDPKVLAYATVSAGASISIPSTAAVVKINDDGDSTMANAVTMPSGTNGKLLYIYNDDADPTTGDVSIASGAMGTFVYVDGWRKAN